MAHTSRIRTPFKQHLHRFRLSVLPAISFVICVIFTLWLWQRQSDNGTVVGEVETSSIEVPAGVAGRLVPMPEGHNYWELFDHVAKGQVIAYLDDKAVQAKMQTVQAEASKLIADLDAAKADLELDQLNVRQQHQREVVRLQWEVERRRVEYLQAYATIESLKSQVESINRSLSEGGLQLNASELRRERDLLQAQLQANEQVRKELGIQITAAKEELDQYPDLQLAAVESALSPIREAVRVQEAVMEEVKVELDNLVITAPIEGIISAVYRYPGQQLMAGDPIVAIAKPDSNYVISYVREQQRIPVYEGMEVGLRIRSQPGSPEYKSSVQVVGPQVTKVPPHQLNDQSVPEWATPVRIPIPAALQQDLRPGQLVHVIFRSPRHGE